MGAPESGPLSSVNGLNTGRWSAAACSISASKWRHPSAWVSCRSAWKTPGSAGARPDCQHPGTDPGREDPMGVRPRQRSGWETAAVSSHPPSPEPIGGNCGSRAATTGQPQSACNTRRTGRSASPSPAADIRSCSRGARATDLGDGPVCAHAELRAWPTRMLMRLLACPLTVCGRTVKEGLACVRWWC